MTGPLTGIRVIDVTSNISGPSLTMILADLGAEVIKIERPNTGDDSRTMGPLLEGEGVYYLNINRNKRSIVINLRSEEGKKLASNLVKDSDVFVENFRYGKAEEMGLGYSELRAINPKIIYCSLTAYGQAGDKKYKPGYDAIIQADTGIMGINGTETGGVARAAVSILDQGSAMWGAIGVISALYDRMKSGDGQRVTTSLYETGIAWMGYHLLSYMATGDEPRKMGSNHAAFAPYGAFATADESIMIGVSNNALFEKVCRIICKEEWVEDERFQTNVARVNNRNELNYLIEKQFKTKSSSHWIQRFAEEGVPCSIIQTVSAVIGDEQTKSTKMLTDVKHPNIDELALTRLPLQLSKFPLSIRKAPPLLGEDTVAILQERGVSQEVIDELITKNVIQSYNKGGEQNDGI